MDSDANSPANADNYVSFGCFDPLLGRRIMGRLARERIRFTARDATTLDWLTDGVVKDVGYRYPYPRIGRINRIELLVHAEDQNLARRVIDET